MNRAALPPLSVVLVAYKSQSDLERCLPTLYRECVKLELIVVDNNPGDGTAAWLGSRHPDVRVVTNISNGGYAGGNNLGIEAATSEFILILNPDTEVHSGSIQTLLASAHRHPDALITAKLLQPDGTLNACGLQLHYTGVTSCRGLGGGAHEHSGLHPVPLVSGAAFIASKKALEALGGFSEAHFMYLEDVDLSLRARSLGLPILCNGDAPITHHYALAISPTKFFYLERNRLLTLLRLYETATLRQISPALLLTELLTWAFALRRGPRYVWARLRGYDWLWRHRGSWRASRRAIQQQRTVRDEEMLADSSSELPFQQLLGSAALAHLLNRVVRGLYKSAPLAPRWLR